MGKNEKTTRRAFLRRAAGGGAAAAAAIARAPVAQARAAAGAPAPEGLPLAVVAEPVSPDVHPRGKAWPYVVEILERAGVFFERLAPADIPRLVRRPVPPLVLLAGDLPLTGGQQDALAAHVRRGGWLIGVGGPSGLNGLFGIGAVRPLSEGWLAPADKGHPILAGLASSLHVFGGIAATPAGARVLGAVTAGAQGVRGAAVFERREGAGGAILVGPDLVFSVVHIQQGLPVLQDGKPAPDGLAPLDDGELKAEDGLVLDWRRDRSAMAPDGAAAFREPVSDELREVILKTVLYAASQQGLALPLLWYWPRGLPAVGHISHDSDGNDPEKGQAMLEVVRSCRLHTTWCILYPGGYSKKLYRAVRDAGCEIALHYDARTRGEHCRWAKADLLYQLQWLKREAEVDQVVSNKNHYTRWEGRLEFWRWCQEAGIRSDQTRGPSKRGACGFPLGGSQPYYAWDDDVWPPRRLDVLEVNMLTQDLVIVCPREYGRQLLRSALRHHGVAHFLFHPAHIQKPHVADALRDLVQYGRDQGMEWWTNERIDCWERRRRSVRAAFSSPDTLVLRAPGGLPGATLMVLRPDGRSRPITVDGRPAAVQPRQAHGFSFDAVTTDLQGDVAVRIG